MKYLFVISCCLLHLNYLYASCIDGDVQGPVYYNLENSIWADSLLKNMSLEQKIGQLFMVSANGKGLGESHYNKIDSLIVNYGIGGLIFFQSEPNELKKILNRYNNLSELPLLTGLDAEWGAAMRIDSMQAFPWMMSMGAIQDNDVIYEFGEAVARQLNELGIHINFAPVIDINNNPLNPIIDRRSFGSDRELVASKGLVYMSALQDNNIIACAKHFPGHGDTDKDSHKSLPVLYHDMYRLDSLELYPFHALIQQGLGGVMMAHMNLPNIDTLGVPSSFSNYLITNILKDKMAFSGLVVSDALNMSALAAYNQPGERELNAFLAGNDILLFSDNIPESIELIKSLVIKDKLLEQSLNHSCKQILMTKKWVGAFDQKKNTRVIRELYHTALGVDYTKHLKSYDHALNRKISKNAITVLKNTNKVFPIVKSDSLSVACLLMGPDSGEAFYNRLNNYIPIPKFRYHSKLNRNDQDSILKQLKEFDLIVVGLHFANNNFWEKHNLLNEEKFFLSRLKKQNSLVLNIFGHPRLLNSIDISDIEALVVSYQNSIDFQDLTAQLMFGSIGASGRLPLSLNQFLFGSGVNIAKEKDLSFVLPLGVGVNLDSLSKIDTLVEQAIANQIMPGCQIVISRYGKVFYNKSFGYHTYDSINVVRDDHLYDLASITKIASTAPLMMHLYDQKQFSINKKLKHYSSLFKGSNKHNLKIIDILTHQAKLFPWIAFFEETLTENGDLIDTLYSNVYSDKYSLHVAKNLYLHFSYQDTIFEQVIKSDLLHKKEYRYSDLGFYLLRPIIENKIDVSIEEYISFHIYDKIDIFRMTYNPLQKFSNDLIVPTEHDNYFRNQLIHGYVHDQGAALYGGVALHAGLFSNAIDLMKLMQLYLDYGMCLDQRVLSKKTIKKFTSSPFFHDGNRRGIIFDKPSIDPLENGPACNLISRDSYGHSGWTGTLAWADPEEEIVYIFLSNGRSYPHENVELLKQNIRTDIQEILYNSIINLNE